MIFFNGTTGQSWGLFAAGLLVGCIIFFLATRAARKKSQKQIHSLAYYDSLTGLPNRSLFKELMKRAIAYSKRYNQIFAVLYIGLDNFKRINDTLGPDIGDLLLKAVAEKLASSMRGSDYVARSSEKETTDYVSRLGGDEFTIMALNLAQAQDAAKVARRLLKTLSVSYRVGGYEIFMTASIGIAVYPDDGRDVDDLLKYADSAMSHAKQEEKSSFLFYSKSMHASALELLTLENNLRKALELNELMLYYQPKLNASTRMITGMEALVRWNHFGRNLISPAQFIPLAETSGLIIPIGEFVLRTACMQNKQWQEAGFKPMSVAVNISSRQFNQKNLKELVSKALQDAMLAPPYLTLEITESTIMRNPAEAVRTLAELKAMGIQIAIDDFGTGYSSLSNLQRLPLDFLKIDQSFVENIASNPGDQAIVNAIIAMAHNLNLKVIAEGVEIEEQLAFLRKQGCDELQGFLFSPAVSAQKFSSLLEKEQL